MRILPCSALAQCHFTPSCEGPACPPPPPSTVPSQASPAQVCLRVSSCLGVKVLAFLSPLWLKERTFFNSTAEAPLSLLQCFFWQKDLLGRDPKKRGKDSGRPDTTSCAHGSTAHGLFPHLGPSPGRVSLFPRRPLFHPTPLCCLATSHVRECGSPRAQKAVH